MIRRTSHKAGSTAAAEVAVWTRIDLILSSEDIYDNPYLDVEVNAVFTHTDGTEIRLVGFWNGNKEWRVRFAPTKAGNWDYVITSNKQKDAGLCAAGSILAVQNIGDSAIDRHGFLKFGGNGRYFCHADGTPFYWLGDTNWQAPNYVSITQCNYPGCDCGNQFQHEVDNRIAKGFNVYQTYFDSSEGDGGGQRETTPEPGIWMGAADTSRDSGNGAAGNSDECSGAEVQYNMIDPQTFTDKIDKMFDYLADRGMVIALGYGVHEITTYSMTMEELEALSRYLTARYASYPVVWITGQEINIDSTGISLDKWIRSAEIVHELDGYHHPQGSHLYPSHAGEISVVKLHNQPWHEWWALQCGHGKPADKAVYKVYWDTGKLFLETECCYEDITCGGFTGYHKSRIGAWKANLCGSYGFTYGVTGIWANCYSTAGNTGWLGSFSHEPWYMGLDKAGSFEMSYMKKFFEYVHFETLIPRFDDGTYSDFTSEEKLVSSDEDGRTYVGYFYNRDCSTGEIRGLDRGRQYTARWYNPLTGKFADMENVVITEEGRCILPQKPTTADWAVLVTSRELGPYETEEIYKACERQEEILPAYPGEIQTPDIACVGGAVYSADGVLKDTKSNLVDGDYDTCWVPFAPMCTQTIIMDLHKQKHLTGIIVTLGQEAYLPEYRVEASDNGSDWRILADATLRKPRSIRISEKEKMYEDLAGEYRYVKLLWLGAPDNTTTKTIAEIEIYACEVEETGE